MVPPRLAMVVCTIAARVLIGMGDDGGGAPCYVAGWASLLVAGVMFLIDD